MTVLEMYVKLLRSFRMFATQVAHNLAYYASIKITRRFLLCGL
jgi:hypothetical protein